MSVSLFSYALLQNLSTYTYNERRLLDEIDSEMKNGDYVTEEAVWS